MKKKIAVAAVLESAANEVEKALEILRNAGKAISENNVSEVATEVSTPEDGIYLVYNDGSFLPFTGVETKDGIHGIGVVYDGHAFQVALKDLGEWPLFRNYETPRTAILPATTRPPMRQASKP